MQKIVCDTMIWYKLGSKEISGNVIGKNSLILTFVSLKELLSSPNIVTEYDGLADACIGVVKYSKIVCLLDSIECLMGYSIGRQERKQLLVPIRRVAYNRELYRPHRHQEVILEEMVQNIRDDMKPYLDFSEQALKQIKANIDTSIKTRGHRKRNLIEVRKSLVEEMCKRHPERAYIEPRWEKHELFIKVLDYQYKRLETGEQLKEEYNDIADIFNMAYVKPGMKYWTHEKKWILIIWDCGMKEYLFVDEEVKRILMKNNRIPTR